MKIIKELTKDCKREDCALVSYGSMTTLMGWSQTYDKHGNPNARDPNTTTTVYECKTCGTEWTVKECDSRLTISTRARSAAEPYPNGEGVTS
jgi:hypothetical protein